MAQNSALPTFGAIYAFGDSLSDAGNLSLTGVPGATFPVSPPYFKEQYGSVSGNVFSNGPVWVQNLSIALGLGTLAPSLTGGKDFAYGGAQTGSTPQNANNLEYAAISLPAQLSQFRSQIPNPSTNALFTVSVGSNDVDSILADTSLTPAEQAADVSASVANEVAFISDLIAAGAKNLLVLAVPDLGQVPVVTSGQVNGTNTPSAALDAEATQLASAYNTALITQLGTLTGATINVVDTFTLLDKAIASPAGYGLTNVTTPVWNGNFTSSSSGTLTSTSPSIQNQSLFFDAYHPTETGQQAIAGLAEQQLSGTPVLAVANTTTGQPVAVQGQPYTGPVGGLQQQFIDITPDSLNITATTPNWFIHSGSGQDAIAVASGTNVLDGGTGSNFFTGGSGTDTFFIDARGAAATIWSSVVNFHAADSVTLWGVTQSDFALSWADGLGAATATGLTLTAVAAGKPEVLLTLAGFTQADLTSGRLSVTSGTDAASGSVYTNIHANS